MAFSLNRASLLTTLVVAIGPFDAVAQMVNVATRAECMLQPKVAKSALRPHVDELAAKTGDASYCASSSWVVNLEQLEERVSSQNGEDGVIRGLVAQVPSLNKYYVEFGVQNGIERNTRFLQETAAWTGLLLDGSYEDPSINLHKEFITPSNIAYLFEKYKVPQNLGLLSVDVDSYDFWITQTLLEAGYSPDIIVTEVNSQVSVGLFTVPPPNVTGLPWLLPGERNFGASPEAFAALGEKFGYKMVYCESRGVNCFMMKSSLITAEDQRCVPSTLRRRPCYSRDIGGSTLCSANCWPTSTNPNLGFYELDANLQVIREGVQHNYASACEGAFGP